MTEALQVVATGDLRHLDADTGQEKFPAACKGKKWKLVKAIVHSCATTDTWEKFSPYACMHTKRDSKEEQALKKGYFILATKCILSI